MAEGKMNIVLAGEEASFRNEISKAFKGAYPKSFITAFADGAELLAYLTSHRVMTYAPPHLIILDLNMPKLDGKTTTEILRRQSHLQGVPIVVLTDQMSDVLRHQLLQTGASLTLQKPATPGAVSSFVAHAIQLCDASPVKGKSV